MNSLYFTSATISGRTQWCPFPLGTGPLVQALESTSMSSSSERTPSSSESLKPLPTLPKKTRSSPSYWPMCREPKPPRDPFGSVQPTTTKFSMRTVRTLIQLLERPPRYGASALLPTIPSRRIASTCLYIASPCSAM